MTILSIKRIRYVIIPNIIIASIVIAGNTFSPTHTAIMLTLSLIYNALVLIIGGYILQGLLIATSVLAYRNVKPFMKDKVDNMD